MVRWLAPAQAAKLCTLSGDQHSMAVLRLQVVRGTAEAHGCTADFYYFEDVKSLFLPTVNAPEAHAHAVRVGSQLLGADSVLPDYTPVMGSEDFGYFSQSGSGLGAVGSSYVFLGAGDQVKLLTLPSGYRWFRLRPRRMGAQQRWTSWRRVSPCSRPLSTTQPATRSQQTWGPGCWAVRGCYRTGSRRWEQRISASSRHLASSPLGGRTCSWARGTRWDLAPRICTPGARSLSGSCVLPCQGVP